LIYALGPGNRSNLSLTYNHGVSNGSGVQLGASTDLVESRLTHRFSRYWNGNFNFGYARNDGLGNLAASQNSQAFNSYYIGGEISRPIGRSSNLSLGYTAQIQTSTQANCASGNCDTSYTSHRIFSALSWHARPFMLR
jgi:hypothetical protein